MDCLFLKIVIAIIFLMLAIVINCIIFYKNNKKILNIILLICILIYLLFYALDYLFFENELVDYLASNMLLSFLLAITFEDIKTNLMDNRVIVGYFIIFLLYRIIFLDLTIFLEGFIGFALSLIIMLIAYFVERNSIGIGDIEAIASCGMIIGFPNIFHFLFKTFLFVFIYGIILIVGKKKKQMNEIPLAPFLLLATIL